jgi:DNA-binding response OmpR family regulator
MTEAAKILVIEDESDIAELIAFNLERSGGYRIDVACDGQEGLDKLRSNPNAYNLIILDIMMPVIDGISVLKAMRQSPDLKSMPVIMLSAKGEESDVVIGLELGADDYVTKPFSPKELLARVRSLLRRIEESASLEGQGAKGFGVSAKGSVKDSSNDPSKVQLGPLEIDTERHEIRVDGQSCPFTLAEFKLLSTLTSRPGRVFTRDQLLERITGGETFVIDRNVDVHIRAIRKKLDAHASLIETVRGVGYKCREL